MNIISILSKIIFILINCFIDFRCKNNNNIFKLTLAPDFFITTVVIWNKEQTRLNNNKILIKTSNTQPKLYKLNWPNYYLRLEIKTRHYRRLHSPSLEQLALGERDCNKCIRILWTGKIISKQNVPMKIFETPLVKSSLRAHIKVVLIPRYERFLFCENSLQIVLFLRFKRGIKVWVSGRPQLC